MILTKEVLIKSYKGYGGFSVMDKSLEPLADNKKHKVRIEISEEKL